MQEFSLRAFFNRSSDKDFSDTTFFKVLKEIPVQPNFSGPWLGGGAIRRTISDQEPDSDFDFFFKDEAQLKTSIDKMIDDGWHQSKETDHHVEFHKKIGDNNRKVQFIRFKYYSNPEEVIDSFDFTICQFVYDGISLYCSDTALWDLARKRLVINKVTYAVSTLRRIIKYTNQGFYACGGCLTDMLTKVVDNPSLREQFDIQYVD